MTKDGKGIELTAREFEILHYMAQNIGRVISKERLYETVWGEDGFGCEIQLWYISDTCGKR